MKPRCRVLGYVRVERDEDEGSYLCQCVRPVRVRVGRSFECAGCGRLVAVAS